jgi:hypothetical protein
LARNGSIFTGLLIPQEVEGDAVLPLLPHGRATLEGVEALHMMGKGQVKRLDGRDATGQAKFVASLFGVAA